jgi:hypothetical protein
MASKPRINDDIPQTYRWHWGYKSNDGQVEVDIVDMHVIVTPKELRELRQFVANSCLALIVIVIGVLLLKRVFF